MTDANDLSESRASAASGYPSRRSLREQQRPEPQAVHSQSEHPAAPSAPSVPMTPTGSVRLPFIEHDPTAHPDPAAGETSKPAKVPFRRRLAAAAAAASVGGLVLTVALPLFAPTGAGTASEASAAGGVVAAQELFSEVSLDELPTSFTEIDGAVSELEARAEYVFHPEALVNYPFASSVTLTDGFGYRTAPVEQFHDAQDFAAPAGTPIQVIADGEVLEAGFASDGCGFGLKVEHEIDGQTVTSRYCHMQNDSHSYQVGDIVKMGDQAGKVGNTGMSFGPHLHLALRIDDEPVDPMPFLSKYTRMERNAAPSTAASTTDAPSTATPAAP
ncbi:M23 family metallopeptidase [Leucobacter tenebrionis]|uniref:M23 family metallopeptidase n=1 Tax=Leucobacter tenebrionis TaxID=2873270 RepID=UPI00210381CB|nr:M23 family metallopeptidase [Leucobacter tenebrionis]